MKIDKNTFLVFDLDDTIYKEREYVESGMTSVVKLVNSLFNVDLTENVKNWQKNESDIFQKICEKLNLPLTVKESLLWQYRLHSPLLMHKSKKVFETLKAHSKGIAILTDGRSISQRLKLRSLGLLENPAYISEEWGSVKPFNKRFVAIEKDFPADKYIYIGDNITKDFKPANELGWHTIGLRDVGAVNIHPQNLNGQYPTDLPQVWVKELNELTGFIC